MTQPAESVIKVFHVMTALGVPVTGLTLSDFTVTAYHDGTSYSHGSTIDELTNGNYKWTYNTPTTAGNLYINIQPTSSSNFATFNNYRAVAFVGEVENQDLDSLYARQARPIVRLVPSGTVGTVQPITLYKERYALIEFTFLDADGDPVLLDTDYNNYQIAVRSRDQATTIWDGSGATITPTDDGLLTIEIPEDAGFFAALAEGENQIALFWEVTADQDDDTDKTVAMIPSSQLTLKRSEVGSGGP